MKSSLNEPLMRRILCNRFMSSKSTATEGQPFRRTVFLFLSRFLLLSPDFLRAGPPSPSLCFYFIPFIFIIFFFKKDLLVPPINPTVQNRRIATAKYKTSASSEIFFFLFFKFLSALSSIITRLSLIHFCFVLFFFCVSFFFNFCFYIVAVSVRLFFDVGGSRSAAPVGGVPLRPRRRRRPIRWRNKRETNRAKRKKKAPPAHRRWPIDPHQHGSLYADRTGHRSRPKKRKTKSKKKRKSKNGRSQKKKTLPRSESSTRCRVDQ